MTTLFTKFETRTDGTFNGLAFSREGNVASGEILEVLYGCNGGNEQEVKRATFDFVQKLSVFSEEEIQVTTNLLDFLGTNFETICTTPAHFGILEVMSAHPFSDSQASMFLASLSLKGFAKREETVQPGHFKYHFTKLGLETLGGA